MAEDALDWPDSARLRQLAWDYDSVLESAGSVGQEVLQ